MKHARKHRRSDNHRRKPSKRIQRQGRHAQGQEHRPYIPRNVCRICGAPLTGHKIHALTDTPACRQRLSRFLRAVKASAPKLPVPAALEALRCSQLALQAAQGAPQKAPPSKSPRPLHSPKARIKRAAAR